MYPKVVKAARRLRRASQKTGERLSFRRSAPGWPKPPQRARAAVQRAVGSGDDRRTAATGASSKPMMSGMMLIELSVRKCRQHERSTSDELTRKRAPADRGPFFFRERGIPSPPAEAQHAHIWFRMGKRRRKTAPPRERSGAVMSVGRIRASGSTVRFMRGFDKQIVNAEQPLEAVAAGATRSDCRRATRTVQGPTSAREAPPHTRRRRF